MSDDIVFENPREGLTVVGKALSDKLFITISGDIPIAEGIRLSTFEYRILSALYEALSYQDEVRSVGLSDRHLIDAICQYITSKGGKF